MQLRRVRVMGENRIELSGFTDAMRDRLRACGLFSEIISWKLRFFVPTDGGGRGYSGAGDRALSRRAARSARRTEMARNAAELARRLAPDAEAVCRHYL